MITTKSCSTCEHFPNDYHCVGCVWDQGKGENTKWELKINPIVIERAVLDKIRAEIIENAKSTMNDTRAEGLYVALNIVDKYRNEVSP